VGPEEVASARARFPNLDIVRFTSKGHGRLDLTKAVRFQLESQGVPANSIFVSDVDTYSSSELFSDRAVRPCGRFALIVSVEP
jgi:copper oxidase (laccase) domain-containing protein